MPSQMIQKSQIAICNSQYIILNSQLLPQTSQQNYVWIFLYSKIGNTEKWVKMDEIIRFSE